MFLTCLAAVLATLTTFLVADALLRPAPKPPTLELVKGKNPAAKLRMVADGFIGEPKKRFRDLMDVFDGDVVFVRPNGDRFDLELTAKTMAKYIMANTGNPSPFLAEGTLNVELVAGSMGARVAIRTIELLNTQGWKIPKLILLDPLHDGTGLKEPAGKWIRRLHWSPGPMQNWVSAKLEIPSRILIGDDAKTEHADYGRKVSASRIADEAKVAADPHPDYSRSWDLGRVIIVRCQSDEDEVLTGQVSAWIKEFRARKIPVLVIQVPPGTHHMGLDTEPALWHEPLTVALAA